MPAAAVVSARSLANSAPTAAPRGSPSPARATTLYDPCGGDQELLKKYLAASPCVFVRGQGSVQATYSGTNVPSVLVTPRGANSLSETQFSQTFGYPGVWLNVGVTKNAQITLVLPSFVQKNGTQATAGSGTSDMEFRYKQLAYVDVRHGILGGILLTYLAPTGSPGFAAPGPAYAFNPLLNIALNRNRNMGVSLAFPLTSAASVTNSGNVERTTSFAPQAVPYWRSPGGTLLAVVVQYAVPANQPALTLNFAQLLSRHMQLQGTFGGMNAGIEYVNPVEGLNHTTGVSYSRSFTIGVSYMAGRSELPPK